MKRIVFLLIPVIGVVLVVVAKMWLGIEDNLTIFISIMLIVGGLVALTTETQKRAKVSSRLSVLEGRINELSARTEDR